MEQDNKYFEDFTESGSRYNFVKHITDLQTRVKECVDILENVVYWDTCPDDYKKRIAQILNQAQEGESDE